MTMSIPCHSRASVERGLRRDSIDPDLWVRRGRCALLRCVGAHSSRREFSNMNSKPFTVTSLFKVLAVATDIGGVHLTSRPDTVAHLLILLLLLIVLPHFLIFSLPRLFFVRSAFSFALGMLLFP